MARVPGRGAAQRPRRGVSVYILTAAVIFFLVVMLPADRKAPPVGHEVQASTKLATSSIVESTATAAADGGKAQQTAQPEAAATAAEAGKPAGSTAANDSGGTGSGGGIRSSSSTYGTGVFFEVPAKKKGDPPTKMELLNEPIPEDCYPEEHADYEGPALVWGLTHKLPSAAQCCQACKEQKQPRQDGMRCNVWVYCGSPTGECWSRDIWNHTTGECWLKYQKEWDNNVDRSKTNLIVNLRGKYTPEFRREHTTAPEGVAWTAGVIPA